MTRQFDPNRAADSVGPTSQLEPKGSFALRLLIFVVAIGAVSGALWLSFLNGKESATPPVATDAQTSGAPVTPPAQKEKIGIAYGTEKKAWMEWAVQEFAKTPEGAGIEINLIGAGSLDTAHRILRKDTAIQVWSPASALYKETFANQWQADYGKSPIEHEEPLALTPMVFVMWDERHEAFKQKLGELTFKSAGTAMADPGGWASIANQPDWTFFKFSHTQPNESNSGLMTLVLLAYDFFGKQTRLTGADLTNADFQKFFEKMESGVVAPSGSLVDSTGRLMDDMVRKGPSTYDAVCVYENVAIDQLSKAEGRWRNKLKVIYPRYNMWNDNPYYVLDVPWSSPAQRQAAEAFLRFLLSEPAQRKAMSFGFRPANTAVATGSADSPFMQLKDYGVQLNLDSTAICQTPNADMLAGLLMRWQQVRGGR